MYVSAFVPVGSAARPLVVKTASPPGDTDVYGRATFRPIVVAARAAAAESRVVTFLPPEVGRRYLCTGVKWLQVTAGDGEVYRVRMFLRSRSGARKSNLRKVADMLSHLGERNLTKLSPSVELRPANGGSDVRIQLQSMADGSVEPRNELAANRHTLLALWNRSSRDAKRNVLSRYRVTVRRDGVAVPIDSVVMLDSNGAPVGSVKVESH